MHGQLAQHFALRSPKAIHLFPGEHAEILGRPEVGKSGVLDIGVRTRGLQPPDSGKLKAKFFGQKPAAKMKKNFL